MVSAVSVQDIGDGLTRTRGAAVDIAFRVRGSGPALVLLHGTSANHAVWEPVSDALEGRATVIALDQRGHGRSDKPAKGYQGDDFVTDVITVLDALGIEHARVAGHSLGGRNAWLAAARYPARVVSAVVVDYTPYVELDVLDALAARVAAGFREFASIEDVMSYLRDRYPRITEDAVRRRARWGYAPLEDDHWVPLASPDAMAQLIDGLHARYDREFHQVISPMVHLRGRSSGIVTESAWQRAIAVRPDDRWVVIDEADHYIPEELPDLVADEIVRTLHT